jgi:hypothetical protein
MSDAFGIKIEPG